MFNKITNEDLEDRGVMGLPATPELSVSELQRKFDEVGKEVIVPKFNAMIEQLNSNAASESLGAKPTSNMHGVGNTVQSILQALDDMVHNLYMGASFTVDATTGHLIVKYPDGSTGDLGQITFLPKGKWDILTEYEPLSLVYDQGKTYASKTTVPKGTPLTNTDYWVKTADTNVEIENLYKTKANVKELEDEVFSRQASYEQLSSRIDSFTRLQTGSTTGDAELIDLRIPASGFNVPSDANAGTAVRIQISDLNNTSKKLSKTLYGELDTSKIKWAFGTVSVASGSFVPSGEDTGTRLGMIDIIPLQKGSVITVEEGYRINVLRFDYKTKSYIGYDAWIKKYTLDDDYYIRIVMDKNNAEMDDDTLAYFNVNINEKRFIESDAIVPIVMDNNSKLDVVLKEISVYGYKTTEIEKNEDMPLGYVNGYWSVGSSGRSVTSTYYSRMFAPVPIPLGAKKIKLVKPKSGAKFGYVIFSSPNVDFSNQGDNSDIYISGTAPNKESVDIVLDVVEKQYIYVHINVPFTSLTDDDIPQVMYATTIDVEIDSLKSHKLNEKTISILGDSISTFAGTNNYNVNTGEANSADGIYTYLGNACRYPQVEPATPLLSDVNDTYWMKLINYFKLNLRINDSIAGSRVSYNGTSNESSARGLNNCMASTNRILRLGEKGIPDIILVNAGTNDIGDYNEGSGSTVIGEFTYDSPPTSKSAIEALGWSDSFCQAYRTMLIKLQYYYPNSRIVVLLPNFTTSYYKPSEADMFLEKIKEICDYFGVYWIDARTSGVTIYNRSEYLPDGIHYNAAGMDLLFRRIAPEIGKLFEV